MRFMGASTTCGRLYASDSGSRNKFGHGARLVSAASLGGTSPFLSSVTSHVILYYASGLSAIHSFIITSSLPSGPPENMSSEPYLQHSRVPAF